MGNLYLYSIESICIVPVIWNGEPGVHGLFFLDTFVPELDCDRDAKGITWCGSYCDGDTLARADGLMPCVGREHCSISSGYILI